MIRLMQPICVECGAPRSAKAKKFCSRKCNMIRAGREANERKTLQAQLNRESRTKPCARSGCNNTTESKYCSRSCSAISNNAGVVRVRTVNPVKICIQCGKVKRMNTDVCHPCGAEHRRLQWMAVWNLGGNPTGLPGFRISHVREEMIKLYGAKCKECGWNKENPTSKRVYIELDHINGDRSDNRIINLRILCPNDHALTPTYRHLNRRLRSI